MFCLTTSLAVVQIFKVCLVLFFLISLEQVTGDVILIFLVCFVSFFQKHGEFDLRHLFYFGPVSLVIRGIHF